MVSKVELENEKKKQTKGSKDTQIMLLLLHGGTLNMTLLYYYYNKTT